MENKKRIEIPKEIKKNISNEIKRYLSDEMDVEIGDLKADIFLEFITEKIGDYYYNIGVEDSITMIKDRTDELYMLIRNR